MDIQLAPGIVTNPERMGGRPTIAGTRITVEIILEKLAAGRSIDDILADYPHLTRQKVLDAIAFAAQLVRQVAPSGAGGNASGAADERERALDELTRLNQEMGLYDR